MRYYKGWTLRDITIDNDLNVIGYIYDDKNELKRKLVMISIEEFVTEFNYYVDSSIKGLTFLSELDQLCNKHNVRLSSDSGFKVNGRIIHIVEDCVTNKVTCFTGLNDKPNYVIGE